MTKYLLVKSGVKQLSWFKDKTFPYFEAYLDGTEDLNDLLKTDMRLLSMHMPHFVAVNEKKVGTNFYAGSLAEEASYKELKRLINFANQNEVRFIIIHLGYFNSLQSDKYEGLEKIAARFNRLQSGKVKLCLENICCWNNLSFENEPIISTEEDFLFFKKRCPKIGAALDVDHLAINAVFQHFYPEFKQKYPLAADKNKFKQEMEQEIAAGTRASPGCFNEKINKAFTSYLSVIQPEVIHAVGSDFCNYIGTKICPLPLVGEALPLNFKGQIEGFKVEDKLNHNLWVSLLKKDVFITLEIIIRNEYDYIEQIKISYNLLKEIILKLTGDIVQ